MVKKGISQLLYILLTFLLGNILIMLKEVIIRVFELEKEKATFFS